MDVTFVENEPFFDKSQGSIQGEKLEKESTLVFEVPNREEALPNREEAPNGGMQITQVVNSEHAYQVNTPRDDVLVNQNLILREPVSEEENEVLELHAPQNLKVYVRKKKQADYPSMEESADTQFWMEEEQREMIQSDSLPQGQDSRENIPEVSSQTHDVVSHNRLPPRINRGKPPKRYGYEPEKEISRESEYPIAKYTSTKRLPGPLKDFVNEITSSTIPEKVEDAMRDPKWVEAMEIEMNALEKNCTWKLVDLPKGKKPVGCKWVFTIKYNAEGKIERDRKSVV